MFRQHRCHPSTHARLSGVLVVIVEGFVDFEDAKIDVAVTGGVRLISFDKVLCCKVMVDVDVGVVVVDDVSVVVVDVDVGVVLGEILAVPVDGMTTSGDVIDVFTVEVVVVTLDVVEFEAATIDVTVTAGVLLIGFDKELCGVVAVDVCDALVKLVPVEFILVVMLVVGVATSGVIVGMVVVVGEAVFEVAVGLASVVEVLVVDVVVLLVMDELTIEGVIVVVRMVSLTFGSTKLLDSLMSAENRSFNRCRSRRNVELVKGKHKVWYHTYRSEKERYFRLAVLNAGLKTDFPESQKSQYMDSLLSYLHCASE